MLADLWFQLHTEEGLAQRQSLIGSSSEIEQCLPLSPSHRCFLLDSEVSYVCPSPYMLRPLLQGMIFPVSFLELISLCIPWDSTSYLLFPDS
jgi:hypothetical protein